MPVIVTHMPRKPPMPQPSTATNSRLGPGAACAIATEALNCSLVIQ